MKSLTTSNINTPQLSEGIFKNRWGEDIHNVDGNRFDQLAKYFRSGIMARYLDVGCFNSPKPGELAEDPYSEIHAIDHAPRVIDIMQHKYPKVQYQVADCYRLPFNDSYFNYVVAGEILEHLEHPNKFSNEMMRVLAPNGVLAISTPYKEGAGEPFVSKEHLWSFDEADMYTLFGHIGEIEIDFNDDSFKVLIAFIKKHT